MRGVIDRKREKKNRFLLIGSSSFELLKNVSESLAGRAAIVELGTLKMNEYYQKELSPFYNIFKSEIGESSVKILKDLKCNFTHQEVMAFFHRGGYPEPVLSNDNAFYSIWMENYFQNYIERDIRKLFPRLNSINYRKFISMLSSLTGTIVNRSELGRSLDTSEVTVKEYLDIAHGSFIWRNIFTYEKSISRSIVKMPKGIIRDSGLTHFLTKVDTLEKLKISPNIGATFESFIIEELIKGLEATLSTGWNCFFYRTRNGAEVDLILEGNFGTIPIEIKYGLNTRRKSLISLSKFLDDNDFPLGIVINNSETVELISEKIIQIPVGLL